jgi:hypothetical protein
MGPHISCWLKGNRQMGFQVKEDCCKRQVSGQSSFNQISFGSPVWVYLYKTYCAKPLLRKHYKERASVVTHFWVPTKYI